MNEKIEVFKETLQATVFWLGMYSTLLVGLLVVMASFIFNFELGQSTMVVDCDELAENAECYSDSMIHESFQDQNSPIDCGNLCSEYIDGGCCTFEFETGSCRLYNSSYELASS